MAGFDYFFGDVFLEEFFDDFFVHSHAVHGLLVHIRTLTTENATKQREEVKVSQIKSNRRL